MGRGKAAIGIMCKPPRPGVSKTRLAAEIGVEAAARLSAAFLQDVAAAALAAGQAAGAAVYALYAPDDAEDELRDLLPRGLHYRPQRGSDLGHTMDRAIGDLLAAGYGGAILTGADMPTLPAAVFVEAVARLRQFPDDIVLGPSEDGGYYLAGMCRPNPQLFRGVAWSTSSVLDETLDRARASGLAVHLLPKWLDVDDGPSLMALFAELRGDVELPVAAGPAVCTRLALRDISAVAGVAAYGG
jgi:rSAM/selenodomain-associated transferase 1